MKGMALVAKKDRIKRGREREREREREKKKGKTNYWM